MAVDEKMAKRVEVALSKKGQVVQKSLMGGRTFMLNGKMCVSVHDDRLMFRIDRAVQDKALKHKGARIMVMGKRVAHGFIHVKKEALTPKEFKYWIDLALDFNTHVKARQK